MKTATARVALVLLLAALVALVPGLLPAFFASAVVGVTLSAGAVVLARIADPGGGRTGTHRPL